MKKRPLLQPIIKVAFLFLISCSTALCSKPFVEAETIGQLGNHLFIIATASALAWDNNADTYFPQLQYNYAGSRQALLNNLTRIFFRCTISEPPRRASTLWQEQGFSYKKIEFKPDMKLRGYFQSERYFAHHRDKILNLYAPNPDDLQYIQTKYDWLLNHPNTVAIQLRKYFEDPQGLRFIQYGKDYLRKAMNLFPDDALFILFSNDIKFAKANIPEEMTDRIKCIENESHIIDLHLISFCKHAIISNSTFGWWGAWLNRNPNKVVITPAQWLHPKDSFDQRDLYPEKWTKLPAKWGKVSDPTTYQ